MSRQLKSKLNLYSNEFSRYCIPNHGFNISSNSTCVPVLNNPNEVRNNRALGFVSNIRFYAAPFQANKKMRPSGPKLNDQITTPFIRLVTDEGHCVLPLREAMARAKSLQLDLVEVDRHEKPPVCKIMDYHKEKYIEKLNIKEKERAKSKTTVKTGSFKEVRFAAKIKQNDLKMKADTVKRLLDSGYRVKCTAIEPTDDVDLNTLLSQFWALIEDVAVIEGQRKVEKKQAFVVVHHIKFGPSKGSSGKKASKDSVASQADSEDSSDKNVLTEDNSQRDVSKIDDNDDDENVFDEPFEFSKHVHVPHTNPKHKVKSVPHNLDASKQMDSPRYQMESRYAKRDVNNQAKSPQSDISEQTFQRRQTTPDQSPPVYNASSRGPSISNSPSKSYGIFSAPQPSNASSGEQKTTTVFNRYKKKE